MPPKQPKKNTPFELQREYVYGTYVDDRLAKVETPGTAGSLPATLYYHTDRQYNVRGLTDSVGNIIELYAYTPYGKQVIIDPSSSFILPTSSFGNAYGYTGRYKDVETGLWYFRARYFRDEMGRFISRDPLGYVDGMSLYGGYFAQWGGMDPMGLWQIKKKIAGIDAIFDSEKGFHAKKEFATRGIIDARTITINTGISLTIK